MYFLAIMAKGTSTAEEKKQLEDFLWGKPGQSLILFHHFVATFQSLAADVTVHPAKSMIGIATPRKRIAWVTQIGKNFIHVVFPFTEAYEDNLCFQKIAQVPGDIKQFNHHFRMYLKEDLNEEVIGFMKLAYKEGS